MRIMITGGAGFIGSAVVRQILRETEDEVLIVDKLTYAGSMISLQEVSESPRFSFERVDICDAGEIGRLLVEYRPGAILHLAAESHVDRSIDGPADFIRTNIVGTFTLLEAAYAYWGKLSVEGKRDFRFLHVSTDEVYGSLGPTDLFHEQSPYRPSSPYSASKASSDHLVRAWHATYGLPTIITNCSNNYGPYQFPEKLIPLMIGNAQERKPLPIYGRGDNIRDWLHVDDHASALRLALARGVPGETYNVGGHNEKTNLEVVNAICSLMDELLPGEPGFTHTSLVAHVDDRPGHDQRYAIDARKIERELGWRPRETFATGLRKTVRWYLDHPTWGEEGSRGASRGERLGLGRHS